MPALFFPNLDALRVAVASGLVPAGLARTPARVGIDTLGRVWLETDDLPFWESLSALSRFGIQVLGSSVVPTRPVACWVEVLQLRRTESLPTGLILFDVPDRCLASVVARLQRRPTTPIGVRLLTEPHVGRAWVTTPAPLALGISLVAGNEDVRAYRQQTETVWTAVGWEHPLPSYLSASAEEVILCDPKHGVARYCEPVPQPRQEEFLLPHRPGRASHSTTPPRIDVRLWLKRYDEAHEESIWMLTPSQQPAFRAWCESADDRLLRQFQIASVSAGGESLLLIRRSTHDQPSAYLPIPAHAFHPDPRLPWLLLPTGFGLRPHIRMHELIREFSHGADQIVWLEQAGPSLVVHSAPEAAFRLLCDQVQYAAPACVPLAAEIRPEELFPFDRFALQLETSIDIELEPSEDPPVEHPTITESELGWVSKSMSRMLRWVRRHRQQRERDSVEPPDLETTPHPRKAPAKADGDDDRVERKLASADVLLHGHDWAARRHELESRLLTDFAKLGSDDRATRWAELATVYAATGQAQDAAVCWVNALWECATLPESWLEHWTTAECRAAKRSYLAGDLERWLGEPGRPGTGRVVAALAAHLGFRNNPPAEFIAALPRVLAILEQQFDDIPVRAAWLARLAVARSCDGDALGAARWYDRLLRRLHDRGPGLDLDEPSFLRFRSRATAERFKVAREWLTHVCEPVRAWTKKPAGIHGLQAVGLAAETTATAEYAQMMLAWGLGVLGERARSRDWAARARKALSSATGPRADPAGHAFLGDLFLHRIKEAHEGHVPKPGLPTEFQERLEKLPEFARYSVDRLREHSRILQPVGVVRAYRGRELREFWGTDRLGERLSLLGACTDHAQINEEARALLADVTASPTTATVPRIVFALLECASYLDPIQLDALLDLVPSALEWIETWMQTGRWSERERFERVSRFRSRMLESAFTVASAIPAERLLWYLVRNATTGRMLPAVLTAAPRIFRTARRCELTTPAEALIEVLDPDRANWGEQPLTPERVGLAAGWFVAGHEETGDQILTAAREQLFCNAPPDLQQRTALALAYAEALGFAPLVIALGRLGEIFQRLDRVTVHCSSNCYFTLQPLRLIDTVVRSVVTDDFTLSPAVRAWLDGDEFLIRRRIHRDMAGLLRECEGD